MIKDFPTNLIIAKRAKTMAKIKANEIIISFLLPQQT